MLSMEKRIDNLEKIVNSNSVVLVNKQDPTERVEISFDGELQFTKITTTETKEELTTTEGL